jgi:predicted O-methyltransferase YrrM
MKKQYSFGSILLLGLNIVCFASPATVTLDRYLQEHKSVVTEGHISVPDCGKEEFFTALIQKESWIKTIGEIGFNAGHSSVTFLAANPACKVVSFDIMVHPYARIGKRFVDATYPNRHTLIEGDSLKLVPAFFLWNSSMRFDLIFIDGGHDYTTAYGDLLNMSRFATEQTLVIVDDLNYSSVAEAWNRSIEKGFIKETQRLSKGAREWAVGRYIK